MLKSYVSDQIKQKFIQVMTLLVLLYGRGTEMKRNDPRKCSMETSKDVTICFQQIIFTAPHNNKL